MSVLLSKHGPRGGMQLTVGPVAWLRPFSGEGWGASVETAVMSAGAWR